MPPNAMLDVDTFALLGLEFHDFNFQNISDALCFSDTLQYVLPEMEGQRCSKNKKTKKVRFVREPPSIRKIASIKDWKKSGVDTSSIWYKEDEYKQIAAQNEETIKKLENGHSMKKKEQCTRGLECETQEGRRRRRQNRISSVGAVLQVQKIHREVMMTDPDTLADICYESSRKCKEEAYRIALEDEKENGLRRRNVKK